MNKIKIKMKYLVLILAVLIIIPVLGYFTLDNILFSLAKNYDKNGEDEKCLAYYDRLINNFPNSNLMPETLYWSSLKIQNAVGSSGKEAVLYIFPDMVGGNVKSSSENVNLDTAIQRYKRLLAEYPESIFSKHASIRLAEVYLKKNDFKNAKKYYEMTFKNYNLHSGEAGYQLAKLYLKENDPQKTLELIDTVQKKYPNHFNAEILFIKGDALAQIGEYDKAKKTYNEVIPVIEKRTEENPKVDINYYREKIEEKISNIDNYKNLNQEGFASLKGRVIIGNQDTKGLKIYLKKENDNTLIPSEPEKFWNTTEVDVNGEYHFDKIVPGEYVVGIGVPQKMLHHDNTDYVMQKNTIDNSIKLSASDSKTKNIVFSPAVKILEPKTGSLLKDSITLKWEKYPNSDYYKIISGRLIKNTEGEITSLYSTILPEKINSNEYELKLDKIKSFEMGRSWNKKGVEPSSILGVQYSGCEIFWGINAYSSDNKILSSSEGYKFHYDKNSLNIINVEKKTPSSADKLLLEQKYEEAIAAYEEILEDEPDNIHALKVLAELYQYGYRYEGKTLIGQDKEKAQIYYQRLYDLTGEDKYNKNLN
jgi:tetratricopeptide (TPR) repeat protein